MSSRLGSKQHLWQDTNKTSINSSHGGITKINTFTDKKIVLSLVNVEGTCIYQDAAVAKSNVMKGELFRH